MRKYILIATTLLASLNMNAQANSIPIIGNKFTFGVDGGLSIPGSDYGASAPLTLNTIESNSSLNGFAKAGFCYDAYAGFKFSKFIGVMIQYGANNNSVNTSDFSSNFSASGTGYTVSEYIVGPYISIKAAKIKLEAKLLGGLVSSNYPIITQSTTLNGVTTSVAEAFSTGNGFGYCAGAKIKYMMLGGLLGIGLGLDYIGSDINFKGNETAILNSTSTSSTPLSNKLGIGILQTTLGLSLDI